MNLIETGKKFTDEKALLSFIEEDGLHGIGVVVFPATDGLVVHGSSWDTDELECLLAGAQVVHSEARICNQ